MPAFRNHLVNKDGGKAYHPKKVSAKSLLAQPLRSQVNIVLSSISVVILR